MSPILPTSTNLPSARKDVQILARVLSGLENRRLTSSSQTIKAQVTEVSQNGNIVFSANNLRIAARISSQLPKTLRVGVPVILLLNSNNTDLAIKVIEPASKITPTAKNRFSSKNRRTRALYPSVQEHPRPLGVG